MPIVRTFISRVQEGWHTEHLLEQLEIRLTGRAQVGSRIPSTAPMPVVFFDDPPVEERHAAVVAELNAIDRAEERQEGDWQAYLAVGG
jgi:hypothetical protein